MRADTVEELYRQLIEVKERIYDRTIEAVESPDTQDAALTDWLEARLDLAHYLEEKEYAARDSRPTESAN